VAVAIDWFDRQKLFCALGWLDDSQRIADSIRRTRGMASSGQLDSVGSDYCWACYSGRPTCVELLRVWLRVRLRVLERGVSVLGVIESLGEVEWVS